MSSVGRQYYAVRYGPEVRKDLSNVKFTKTRVFSGVDACMQTFGRVTSDMFVKGIGGSKTVLMSQKGKLQIIDDPEGWISMTGVIETDANIGTIQSSP